MTTDIEEELEKMSLLEGRYYIILKPTDDENFSLSAYATVAEAADGGTILRFSIRWDGPEHLLQSRCPAMISGLPDASAPRGALVGRSYGGSSEGSRRLWDRHACPHAAPLSNGS